MPPNFVLTRRSLSLSSLLFNRISRINRSRLLALIPTIALAACSALQFGSTSPKTALPGEARQDSTENSKQSQLVSEPGGRAALVQNSALSHLNPEQFQVYAGFRGTPLALFRGAPAGYLLALDDQGVVLLWEIKKNKARKVLELPHGATAAAYAPDRDLFAAAWPGDVRIYSLLDGQVLFKLDRVKARVNELRFDPQREALLMAASDSRIYRWKFQQERETSLLREQDIALERYIGHPTVVSSVVVHPLGRVFFTGDWDGTLAAWEAFDADRLLGQYDENIFGTRFFSEHALRKRVVRRQRDGVSKIAISGDGTLLFVALNSGALEIWKVRGFFRVGSIPDAHAGLIYAMDVSSDGTLLASAGRDGFLRLWNVIPHPTEERELTLDLLDEQELQDVTSLMILEDKRVVAARKKSGLTLIESGAQ